MIDLCKKCFELNGVGSFYCDASKPDTHLTGYIEAYNERELLIKHISKSGFYDGFILVQMSNLIRVDILGRYEKRIAALYAIRKQSHPRLNHLSDTLYDSMLDYARVNNLIISVELENTLISGFVLDFDEQKLRIRVVDEDGQVDGETIILIEDTLCLAVDTDTEQNMKLLGEQGVN